eukprot:TRINITY_DN6596_c0_g1_i3.p1 TRINITY_DN6596_c0_g1~~TRINITY_DN6596_c0_g1_i3.p1  ORF type:complete len:814 (-),score=91.59 TRINITY_DN6596_c0_g1_i3:23-2365(-)
MLYERFVGFAPWLSKRKTSNGGDRRIVPLSQRFREHTTEKTFLSLQSPKLLISLQWCCGATWVVGVLVLASRFQGIHTQETATDAVVIYSTWVFLLFLSAVTFVCARALDKVNKLHPQALELHALVCCCILMTCSPLIDGNYAGRTALALMGTPASERLECSDARLVSVLNTVLVASHFVLPIRWCLMWILEIFFLALYILLHILVGSCDDTTGALFTFFILIVLTVVTAYGKRVSEFQERSLFIAYLHEKKLRFQSEFALERASSEDQLHNQSSCSASQHSATVSTTPSTTPSSHVFTLADHSMEDVQDLGRKEKWLISDAELDLEIHNNGCARKLGSGSFGDVFVGAFQGSPVAIKVISKFSSSSPKTMLNEVRLMRRLRHPNIVQFYGAHVNCDSSEVSVVMEVVEGPLLDNVLANESTFSAEVVMATADRLGILVGVSCALRYLHCRSPVVVHGDLKSSNVMLEPCCRGTTLHGVFRPKLLDFGLSRALTSSAQNLGGSVFWVAPEVVQDKKCKPRASADVFSFGRLMQHVITSQLILLTEDGTVLNGEKSVLRYLRKGNVPRFAWPEDTSRCLTTRCSCLTLSCVNIDRQSRPSMETIHRMLVGVSRELCQKETIPTLQVSSESFLGSECTKKRAGFCEQLSKSLSALSTVDVTDSSSNHQPCLNPSFGRWMLIAETMFRFYTEATQTSSEAGIGGCLLLSSPSDAALRDMVIEHKCPAVPPQDRCAVPSDKSLRSLISIHVTVAAEVGVKPMAICIRCAQCFNDPANGASRTTL